MILEKDVYWQAVTYAANFSEFTYTDIINMYEKYLENLGISDPNPKDKIEEFVEEDIEKINQRQRLILVSKEFHPDVLKAVLWLRDFEIDVKCVRLKPYIDDNKQLFIIPEVIIPTPGVEDYIEKKTSKQKLVKKSYPSPFSLEKGNFNDNELKKRLKETLTRDSDLTPRLTAFMKILLSDKRPFSRNEIKQRLFDMGIGKNIGQTGRYLSNISQFLTKKSTLHLRQIIEFEMPRGVEGEIKDNYKIVDKYYNLVKDVLKEISEST